MIPPASSWSAQPAERRELLSPPTTNIVARYQTDVTPTVTFVSTREMLHQLAMSFFQDMTADQCGSHLSPNRLLVLGLGCGLAHPSQPADAKV